MVVLRPFRADDLDALYRVCLATGDAGQDATALHNDPKAVGAVYAAPYGALEPDHVFVAEDQQGVGGYVVGTYDSNGFAERLEREWWPALRAHYETVPNLDLTAADRERIGAMQLTFNPSHIVAEYPAHIHMNLLPHLRGQRVGSGLLKLWIDQARADGVRGIHLGANAGNAGGIAFWTASGFKPLETIGRTAWFGMTL